MSENFENLKEIDEAIAAGKRALSALEEARVNLDAAKGYGVWDIIGGGFISGMLKHSSLDEAQEYMELAKYELDRFKKELKDVSMSYEIDVNFDGFSRFVDFFFDGFFVDFMIQSQIKDNYNKVEEIKEQVQTLVYKLKGLRMYEEERLSRD